MTYRIQNLQEYQIAYNQSIESPENFWATIAEYYQWKRKWDQTLAWNFAEPSVKWFIGGKLNITENCLDRHLLTKGNQIALIWEPNDPQEPVLQFTYKELANSVNRMANILKNIGVQKGDRVCIYLPMIPELAFSVLAC
ncbi:MAG: AMP-binding protein, partial [Bacteroidia bacterium]|nr:AMP-binding protein [Bacteroidia bacterium]